MQMGFFTRHPAGRCHPSGLRALGPDRDWRGLWTGAARVGGAGKRTPGSHPGVRGVAALVLGVMAVMLVDAGAASAGRPLRPFGWCSMFWWEAVLGLPLEAVHRWPDQGAGQARLGQSPSGPISSTSRWTPCAPSLPLGGRMLMEPVEANLAVLVVGCCPPVLQAGEQAVRRKKNAAGGGA